MWLHNLSDGLIWFSYMAIPTVLFFFVRRRRDVPFPKVFWMFGSFIVLCGLTHLVEILMTFQPMYRFSALVKAATGGVSIVTFVALIPLLPVALALRSPRELEALNRRLEDEIAERRRAQEELARLNLELRAKEEFARSITESASDSIVSADASGLIVSWNRGAERAFGYSAAEAVGRPLTILMPERYRDAHAAGLGRRMSGKPSRVSGSTLALEGLRKDGTEFPMELRVDEWEAGGKRFFTGIIRDISERKRRDEEILGLNKDLEAFCYSVSHDLRGPLRIIDGYTRLLQEDCEPAIGGQAQQYTTVIRSGVGRMHRLIDDLLAFSRSGREALKAGFVDAQAVASAAYAEIEALNPDREIDFRLGTLPPCHGDASMIRQVFMNLLSNAVKYSRDRRPAVVEVSGLLENGETVYTVKDNGVGFDMQYAHKLFGVFERLHSTREFEGSGVGLAIVQRIVQRHGGRVWADARPGEGAVFRFSLPRGDTRAE